MCLKKVENELMYLSNRSTGGSSLHFWFSLKAETKVMAAGQVLQNNSKASVQTWLVKAKDSEISPQRTCKYGLV